MSKNVTEQDLIELFGLGTTNYLRNTCHVKLILCSKTNNSRGFAFVTGPGHVLNELIKLNGTEFQEKNLAIDEAKKKPLTPSLTPFLTNKPKSFFKTHTTETGLSDYHKTYFYIF